MSFAIKILQIFFLIGVLYNSNVYAGNEPKKIKVETETKVIKENQPFRITFSISLSSQSNYNGSWSNTDVNLQISGLKIDDFNLIDGPNKSSSSSYSNGSMTYSNEFSYILIPKKSGRSFIAPVKCVAQNQDFWSDTFWITNTNERISGEDSLEKLNALKRKNDFPIHGWENMFADFYGGNTKTVTVEFAHNMDTVYNVKEGEQFVVTYVVPFTTVSSVQIKDQPCPTGIIKLDELPKSTSTEQKWKNGTTHQEVSSTYPVKFMAQKEGKYRLSPRIFAYDGHEYSSPAVIISVTK